MITKTIGFVGGGRAVKIILGGLARAGALPRQVLVSDPDAGILNNLKKGFPSIEVFPGNNTAPAAADIVFISLHPPLMAQVLEEIKPALKPSAIVVSLAPKPAMAKLAGMLGGFKRLARLLPNAPSIINSGYNPVAFAPALDEADKSELLGLFKVLGECPEISEDKFEAYATFTAMGPTYLWFQLQKLAELETSFGLSREETEKGIAAMTVGAVKTLFGSGLSAGEVMDLVPVKPMKDDEESIKNAYAAKVSAIYQKLKS